MNEIWAVVHKERDALVQDLSALNPAQWTTPSLCPGWDVHAVLAHFHRVCNRTTSAPAPLVTPLVEVFVHGEDIRRPLGIDHEYSIAEVSTALRYQANASVAFGRGKERVEGLRISATDASFDFGVGAEVRGSAIALLLAVSGRPVRAVEISGPGALSLTKTNAD